MAWKRMNSRCLGSSSLSNDDHWWEHVEVVREIWINNRWVRMEDFMHDWKLYRIRGYYQARPYVKGESLDTILVPNGMDPEHLPSGMVVRNANGQSRQIYMTDEDFHECHELATEVRV